MQTITEPQRKIPIRQKTDVLVIGSGPGGLSAAISCARMGVKTLLVERNGCFGGNLTLVGVESIAWYRQQETVDIEGIGLEFEKRAKQAGASYPEIQSNSEAIHTEKFKQIADEWIDEAGVTPLLHAYAVAVIREGDQLKGVILESKSGREAILADYIIDASGDADLVHFSGEATSKTAREKMLAVTVMFSCSGVDKQKFLDYIKQDPQKYKDWGQNWQMETSGKEDELFSPYLEEPFIRARQDGLIPTGLTNLSGTWSSLTEHGEATYLNMIHLDKLDGTDVADLTRGEIEGRKQAIYAIRALNRYVPGFGQAALRNFGMILGIRDTRKIFADYTLTGQDVRNQAQFEDSIGIFPEFIDGYGILILPTTGRYYQIPFRSLIPRNLKNVLVAGRAIGGDAISHASVRNMMCCTVTGQAAGVAAGLAVHQRKPFRQLLIADLQKALTKQGVRLY